MFSLVPAILRPHPVTFALLIPALPPPQALGQVIQGPGCPLESCGRWSQLCDDTDLPGFEMQVVHAALVYDGQQAKVLFLAGREEDLANPGSWTLYTDAFLWTPGGSSGPACGTVQRLAPPLDFKNHTLHAPMGEPECFEGATPARYTTFCSGHDFDAEGHLMIVSGEEVGGYDSAHTTWFDPSMPVNAGFTAEQNLNRLRWYPSVQMHPATGETYAWTGRSIVPGGGCDPPPLTSQTVEHLIPGVGREQRPPDAINVCHPPMELYVPVVHVPQSWPVPSEVGWWLVVSHPGNQPQPATAWVVDPTTIDPQTNQCERRTTIGSPSSQHRHGPYLVAPFTERDPAPDLYLFGVHTMTQDPGDCESCVPHNQVSYFDASLVNGPGSPWVDLDDMHIARQHADAVWLPDGTIFVVGGGQQADCNGVPEQPCASGYDPFGVDCAALTPEIFNPFTPEPLDSWTEVARHRDSRMDHTTAILLPDSRVLVTGGEYYTEQPSGPLYCGQEELHEGLEQIKVFNRSFEIYEPPYFFNIFAGPRPDITAVVETTVPYSCEIRFTVDNWAANAQDHRVFLTRPGSMTHSSEMSARTVFLSFTQAQVVGSTYAINASIPGQSRIQDMLPEGWYMLWAVRDWGTAGEGTRQPCVEARWIRLDAGASCTGFGGSVWSTGLRAVLEPLVSLTVRTGRAHVELSLDVSGAVRAASVDLYDSAGRHVIQLADRLESGENRIVWNGTTTRGHGAPSGVYFVRVTASPGVMETRKVVFVR